jgi:hypothetical protein
MNKFAVYKHVVEYRLAFRNDRIFNSLEVSKRNTNSIFNYEN